MKFSLTAAVTLVHMISLGCSVDTNVDRFDLVSILNGDASDQAEFVSSFNKDRANVNRLVDSLVAIGQSAWQLAEDRSHGDWIRVTIETLEDWRYDVAFLNPINARRSSFVVLPHSRKADQSVELSYTLSELADSGECRIIRENQANHTYPIASVSKLATIGAVLATVNSNELSLDDELQLTDSVRSLPTGTWHTLTIGVRRTVQEALKAVLVNSDNTAHDLLMTHIGRTKVHDYAVKLMGHRPDLPFFMTSELFKLNWSASPELQSRFAEGSHDIRIDLLETDIRHLQLPDLTFNENPVDPILFQWFAKLDKLCNTWSDLLSDPNWEEINNDVIIPPEFGIQGWSSLGHKNGVSPGVRSFSGTALLPCGATVVYSASIVSHTNRLREDSVFDIAINLSEQVVDIEEILCGTV